MIIPPSDAPSLIAALSLYAPMAALPVLCGSRLAVSSLHSCHGFPRFVATRPSDW
jgi:hypothetical protein